MTKAENTEAENTEADNTGAANIVSFPDLAVIEEQAAAWIAKIEVKELQQVELDKLGAWLALSPQHQEAFDRMNSLWNGAEILDDLNGFGEDVGDKTAIENGEPVMPWWGQRMLVGAIAASVMVVAGVTALYDAGMFTEAQPTHFLTQVGEQKTIALSDGSTVILNTDSVLDIELTENSRIMRLTQGEAHFDVAPNPDRPFLVYAGDGIVKAVGTAFTVYLRKKAVEVTVSEGVVALIARPKASMNTAQSLQVIAELKPIAALTAGQNAVFAEKVEHVESMSEEALGRKLLWHGGFIAFSGEPLLTVIEDVSRYTDIRIEIDPDLETLPVGGYFKIGEIDGMFEALETAFGVHVERVSPSHVILSSAS
ncbi:MAG: FecR domain-containing protein [Kordiimonadaceae bacterium]|nr:FecR domain-containing protein [Kordiimonadaceae bacterium]